MIGNETDLNGNICPETILLVEDDGFIALEESRILEDNGFTVIPAVSGDEAVELVRSGKKIDLVLMDINLGDGMDGTEAAEMILKHADIPLIFLSSHTEKDVIKKTEGITSYGYVVKHTGETALITSIKMAFKLFAAKQELKEGERILKAANNSLNSTFNSINDAIILIDLDRTIEKTNEAFKIFTGKTQDEIIGKKCISVVHQDSCEAENCPFEKMLETHQRERTELERDGRFYDVIVDPLFDDKGNLSKAVHLITDVTTHKTTENILNSKISNLTKPDLKIESLKFEELFNLKEIQKLQDDFSAATGVASIITTPDGIPITETSNFTRFCHKVVRGTEKGLCNCMKSDALIGKYLATGPTIQKCLSGGLWDAGAGLSVGGHHIANWLIGQVKDETVTEEHIAAYARGIGADVKEAVDAFNEVKSMSAEEFEHISELLYNMADTISSAAYQNLLQGRVLSQVLEDEEKIKKLLHEKDVFLKEVHHRIKNNMASVEGLLSLQKDKIKDKTAAETIQAAALRVSSVRILYEKLLSADEYSSMPVESFVKDIVGGISCIYPEKENVRINFDIEQIRFDSKQLFQLGLIVNEIVTNIYKHAFAIGAAGTISVRLKHEQESGLGYLEIADNGKGFSEGFSAEKSESFGMLLIRLLAEQMGGELTFKNSSPGTVCRIVFRVAL